jgi:hypothetical protein
VLDLREKYRQRKQTEEIKKPTDPMQSLVNSIKKTIQDFTYKSSQKKSFTSVLKNSIFDLYVTRDEPERPLRDTEMSRIPFKEFLLSSGIEGELFISGIKAAADPSILVKNHIRSVVAIGSCTQLAKFTSITGGYLDLAIAENETEVRGFVEHYVKAIRFIERKLKEGSVLVCCYYGVCRSVMIVLAYLMKVHRTKFAKALAIVKKGRNFVSLSQAAVSQMLDLEVKIFPNS